MKKNSNIPTVVILSRWPVLGSVKTRLAEELGIVKATQFARNSLNSTIKKLQFDKRWNTLLAITPGSFIKKKLKGEKNSFLIPQGKGDLGKRMWKIKKNILQPVIIIGSDIPEISKLNIIKAIKLLNSNDVVIGPSSDGGYWLIGFSGKKNILYPFKNIRWSSCHALEDTYRNINNLNISINFCDKLTDIDDKKSFIKYKNNEGLYLFESRHQLYQIARTKTII